MEIRRVMFPEDGSQLRFQISCNISSTATRGIKKMNQVQPVLWSDCFDLNRVSGPYSSPDTATLDFNNLANHTSSSDEELSARSWTASPVQLSDLTFDTSSQYSLWDNKSPVMQDSEQSYSDTNLLRKSRRHAPSLDTRRAQNRAAQRAYRQRAALHLKTVEEELASLKQRHGALMQRYEELNCWSNALLSALLEKDPSWESAASGMSTARA